MKLIQKYLDFRCYLATVNDYVTGEETDKHPKIHLFMILDAILMLSSAVSSVFVYIWHICSPRYLSCSSRIPIIVVIVLILLIGAGLSSTANFKKWRGDRLVMAMAYCCIFCSIPMIVVLDSSPALYTLFRLNLFSSSIEVDALLIFTCVDLIAWCTNSIFMYRYKVHLYRRLFISNSNIPLRR